MKILVIENDRHLIEIFREFFDLCGHECEIAINRETAILLLFSSEPDIIIADLPLPDFDCHRFVSNLKDNNIDKSKVIVMSDNDLSISDRRALNKFGIAPISKIELPLKAFRKNIPGARKTIITQK
jgi:DNA-binding response OmpR family regulator